MTQGELKLLLFPIFLVKNRLILGKESISLSHRIEMVGVQ
jgi:hypothetical protein